jgi:hypothetical protein
MKKIYSLDLKDDNLYKLLQKRFLLLFLGLIAGIVGVSFFPDLGVNPFILFFGLIVAISVGFNILDKSFNSPVFIYCITQFIFVWMFIDDKMAYRFGFSAKINMLTLGLASVIAFICFFKHFNYLWKNFPAIRYLFFFFLLNIPYFLFYHSNFNLADYKTGYDVRFNSQNEDSNANLIVFLDSVCPLVGYTIGLMLFSKIKSYTQIIEKFKELKDKIIKLFFTYYSIIFLSFLVGLNPFILAGGRLKDTFVGSYGPQVFLSFFFILFLAFWVYQENFEQENLKISRIKLILLILSTGVLVYLLGNRTSLAGIIITSLLFFFACKQVGFKFKIFSLSHRSRRFMKVAFQLSVIIIPTILLFYLIFYTPESLTNKIDEFFNPSTMNVRTTNWNLFMIEWADRFNFNNALIGFGLGASRETIFFVSAMQGAGHLVQTVHNHLVEVIFDYGAVSVFYFIPYLYVLVKNIINLKKYPNLKIKLFALTNVCLVIFFFIYHQTDGIRVTTGLIFFSMLGLLDSLIYSLINNREKN